MSKTKFTKGEWSINIVEKSFPRKVFVRSKNDEGVLILLETQSIANFEEQKANAILISAAPDLFKSLLELYLSINSCVDLIPDILFNARKAIRKAVDSDFLE